MNAGGNIKLVLRVEDGTKAATEAEAKAKQKKAAKKPAGSFVPTYPSSPTDVGFDTEVDVHVSGRNGIRYPARYCTKTNRLRVMHLDSGKQMGMEKSLHIWETPVQGWWEPLLKNVGAPAAKPGGAAGGAPAGGKKDGGGKRFSREEIESMSLRWITVHPNGDDGEGVPVLVHDDGSHYTVVGGAGGSLNQLVMPKGRAKSKDEKKEQASARADKREQRRQQAEEAAPEQYMSLQDKREELKQQIADKKQEFRSRVMHELGIQMSPESVRKQAAVQAKEVNPKATDAEVNEFVKKAEKEFKAQQGELADKIVNAHLDQQATKDLGVNIDDETVPTIRQKMGGREVVVKPSQEQLKGFIGDVVQIETMQRQARAIDKALRTGDYEQVKGLEMMMAERDPSDEEIAEWTQKGYLGRKEVMTQVALVKGAHDASPQSQVKFQAAGSADGANAMATEFTGYSIIDADTARELGPEAVARITAAWIVSQGGDPEQVGQQLQERHAQLSYAKAASAIKSATEMDQIVDAAMSAAERGDGTVEWSQAGVVASNFQSRKARLFNSALGYLRTAAATHVLMSGSMSQPLELGGGASRVEAHKRAQKWGLAPEDYDVTDDPSGGYRVSVDAEAIHKMAKPLQARDEARYEEWENLEADVDGKYQTDSITGINPEMRPFRHQAIAVEAICRFKKFLLNYGAGSGKTGIYYMAAARLMNEGQCTRGIITMPAAVRAEQVDGVDPNTGAPVQGKLKLWTEGPMRDRFVVCDSKEELTAALDRVKNGEELSLIMTPHTLRNNSAAIMEHYGKEGTYAFIDEAHEQATAEGGESGSGMARAVRSLVQGASHAALGSGTLIQQSAGELHTLSEMVYPGMLPSKKQFGSEWESAAQSGDPSQLDRLRGMFHGRMASYHEPVTRDVDDGTGTGGKKKEEVPLVVNQLVAELHPLQQQAIASANQERKRRLQSGNKNIATSAPMWFANEVMRISTQGVMDPSTGELVNPKMDKIAETVDAMHSKRKDAHARGDASDPHFRFGIFSKEKKPLAAAQTRMGKSKKRPDGKTFVRVTGDQNDDQVRKAVIDINNRAANPDTGVHDQGADGLLLTSKGNYGINCQGLDAMFMAHATDNPAKRRQVIGRGYRTGQDRPFYAFDVLSNDPREMSMQYRTMQGRETQRLLLEKIAANKATEGDETGLSGVLSDHVDAILAAAGVDAESAAEKVINRPSAARARMDRRRNRNKKTSDEEALVQKGLVLILKAAPMLAGDEDPNADPNADPEGEGEGLDPDEPGDQVSSLSKMHDRLQYEMARACGKYDDARQHLSDHFSDMDAESTELEGKKEQLHDEIQEWFTNSDGNLDRKMARKMVEYLQACHLSHRTGMARRIAYPATQPPGEPTAPLGGLVG